MIKNIEGSKGKDETQKTYVPTEDPNTLQSKAVARIIDVLCEGEIEGFYEATIEKSIYFDETPLKDNSGNWNFQGISTDFKIGLPDQDHIAGFPSVESEINVSTQLKVSTGPITKTVSDTNIDDIRVTVSVPRLSLITDKGDIKASSVQISVKVKPDGGAYTTVKTLTISGKCISLYQRSYLITNLSQYGAGPWDIQLTRVTADSGSAKLTNDTHWVSYTTIINERMIYPDTSLIGITVDSEQFGNRIPRRSYDLKGLKIKIPNNYTVSTRAYAGSWSGTFKTEWCDNPAWVYYDLLTNTRYGMGLNADKVDKWALYTIAQYCDTLIDDGYGSTEPRFVCNLIINTRKEAIHVLNMLTSVFRGMPLWSSGQSTTIQDCPKDPVKLVTAANVIDGEFNYEGSGLKARHTVANVTWNDIDDFCRPQIEYVEDADGIARYGWRPIDVVAYGTTSRGQANRVGKWIIDSEINETEIVQYKASFDQADVLPGDIVEISDPHYTGGVEHRYGGRIIAKTADTLTIDNAITITGGKTYTLAVVLPDGSLDEDIEIINAPGSVTVLELATSFDTQPQIHAIWMVTVSDCAPRKFRIIANTEDEPNIYNIVGLYYDANKFARIEEGIYFDEISESDIPIGAILPPTALAAEEFRYIDGGAALYGVILSWIHPDEPRKIYYNIQSRSETDGFYIQKGITTDNSFDIKPVTSGTYDYRVRTVASDAYSPWSTLTEFAVMADDTLCSGVENLQVLGGGTTFNGPDCEIEWDDSDCHLFKEYKVEVSEIDDTPLRTEYVVDSHYNYTYQMNADDNSNSAIRSMKFKVYIQNIYDKAGESTTLVAENPAPSMASNSPTLTQGYSGITIDWHNIIPADNDMLKYKIYANDSTPPTSIIHICDPETTYFHWWGLNVGTIYYIQIEPWDMFGAGTKSNIVNEEPVVLPDINIDVELLTSIVMTDSDDNSGNTLAKLYNRNKTSDGISYTISGTDSWINYKYAVDDIFDRVIIYTADANTQTYIAYSNDGSDWSYLTGEADHTLTVDNELVTASGINEAQTNYWQTVSGTNVAIFPAMIAGRYMRLYMTGTYSTEIYELVFFREIIAEMAAIDNLAALSANMGTITAGNITLDISGFIRTTDKDNYADTTAGFFLGYDGGAYKFNLGNDTNYIKWDGSDLTIEAPMSADSITLDTDGYVKTTGKDNYADTTAGFWLGYDTTAYKLNLGDATDYLKWDGSNLSIKGSITITAGSYAGDSISTTYTAAKCTDVNADQTSTHTAANAAVYTGSSIATTYTAAKCTDANADQTSAHTANNTSNVGTCPASTVQGWRYGSTTYINGGDIYTNTVTATQISVTSLSTLNANMGTITAGNITLNTSGFVRTSGKDNYADTTAGFFLGYDSGYKLNIGSATNYLKWDGSNLILTGKVLDSSNWKDYAVGNFLVIAADTERYFAYESGWTKVKEILLEKGGSLRIKFSAKDDYASGNERAKIYRNGAAVGTLRILTSSYQEWSQDISGWSSNDYVQLYIYSVSYAETFVKQFRLYASDSTAPAVILD